VRAADQVERIHQAKRAGTRGRLIGEGILERWVDAWLEAWAAQDHGDRFAGDYWQRAHDWVVAEHEAGRRP
jgi:hypothetical protein